MRATSVIQRTHQHLETLTAYKYTGTDLIEHLLKFCSTSI